MAAKEGKLYGKNKATPFTQLNLVNELVEFFDKHDMGEYWDQLPKAEFEVNIKTRKHLVAIDENYSQTEPNRKIEKSHPQSSSILG
jgi:hypothetical protein